MADPVHASKAALQAIARRIQLLEAELTLADQRLATLVGRAVPWLLGLLAIGNDHAGQLLVTAGQHPRPAARRGRLRPPVRSRPDPGQLRQDPPPPAAPRRAGPIERQQLKWLAFVSGGSGLAGATGFLTIAYANSAAAIVGGLLLVVALVGSPLASQWPQ